MFQGQSIALIDSHRKILLSITSFHRDIMLNMPLSSLASLDRVVDRSLISRSMECQNYPISRTYLEFVARNLVLTSSFRQISLLSALTLLLFINLWTIKPPQPLCINFFSPKYKNVSLEQLFIVWWRFNESFSADLRAATPYTVFVSVVDGHSEPFQFSQQFQTGDARQFSEPLSTFSIDVVWNIFRALFCEYRQIPGTYCRFLKSQ